MAESAARVQRSPQRKRLKQKGEGRRARFTPYGYSSALSVEGEPGAGAGA